MDPAVIETGAGKLKCGPITLSNCVRVEGGRSRSEAILELGSWIEDKIEEKGWEVLSWTIVFSVRDGYTIAIGTCTFYECEIPNTNN